MQLNMNLWARTSPDLMLTNFVLIIVCLGVSFERKIFLVSFIYMRVLGRLDVSLN